MKQHISEEQFNKLPNKAQQSLRQWTIGKEYAVFADSGQGGYGYPRLSIGQLIEFLAENKKDIHIERFDGGAKNSHWDISTCYNEEWRFGQEQKELCDALWEAVIKDLENNK